MNRLEARDLNVGDMIIFYDYDNQEIIKGRTLYYEVVEGKKIPADLGLVVDITPDAVKIDWFSELGLSKHDVEYDNWEQIEKA